MAGDDAALDPVVEGRLRQLVERLLECNQQFNLTAIRDPEDAWVRHVLDSLQGLKSGLLEGSERVIDVGSGAGFPGLPLALARPNLQVTLLEAAGKKCRFLEAAVAEFAPNALVCCDRAEHLGQLPEQREQYDVATARAVGSFSEVCELTLPLLKIGGHALLWRGNQGGQEFATGMTAVELMGGQCSEVLPYRLPGHHGIYHLIAVLKASSTPIQFPRRPGVPHRKPLSSPVIQPSS